MTAAVAAAVICHLSCQTQKVVAQVLVEVESASAPVRITMPVQSPMTGSGVLVVSLVVVTVPVGASFSEAAPLDWRSALGDVALSEHAASTRTAPPKNNAFFQPI